MINISQLITEARSLCLPAQKQGRRWKALVSGENMSMMETAKNIPKVIQEVKHICGTKHMAGDERIPERVLSWWPHTLCHIFCSMAVGRHFPSLCSGICWPRGIQPPTWQRGLGSSEEHTGPCAGVSHRPVWCSVQGKLHDFWNLGLL